MQKNAGAWKDNACVAYLIYLFYDAAWCKKGQPRYIGPHRQCVGPFHCSMGAECEFSYVSVSSALPPIYRDHTDHRVPNAILGPPKFSCKLYRSFISPPLHGGTRKMDEVRERGFVFTCTKIDVLFSFSTIKDE